MKSYEQYCPMSYALDVIGDRWTLHIVRDLMPHPLRYKDLKAGLPNIATNLLAKRLKELEANGIIEQKTLPPPASVNVYALTERGYALRPVMVALSQWGYPYLTDIPDSSHSINHVQLRGILRTTYSADLAKNVDITTKIETENFLLTAQIKEQRLTIIHDDSLNSNVTIYVKDLHDFVSVINRVMTVDEAVDTQAIVLKDSSEKADLQQWLSVFAGVAAIQQNL